MAFTIDPSAVVAEYGSFYINHGQNFNNLLLRPYEAFGTRTAFTNVPTDDTQLRYSDVQVGEVLQKFQKAFTPKGSVAFSPITINLKPVKVDITFMPDDLKYTWLGFLTANNLDRTQWPYTRWYLEVHLFNQIQKDLETKVIYNGEEVAVTPGTAGAAIEVIDGIKKQINDGVTAGSIVPISMGAVPTVPADFCTYIEEMVEQLPELYWSENIQINMSKKLALRYRKGRKAKYNENYAQIAQYNVVENFENISVIGRDSMQGSEKIWGTPKENAVFATKGFANASDVKIETSKREVHIFTDFHIMPGFLLKDLVFTNDVELAA